ncbi:MAG: hypothetical protein C0478_02645 [Planctomyces sp.]|nr:hypothetical protein [Planctomyces sp.]
MLAGLLARSQSALVSSEPFLVLPENHFAYTAAMRIAEPLGSAGIHGPKITVVHGPTGGGKTHLCRQAAREAAKRLSRGKLLFVRAQEFTTFLVEAAEQRASLEAQSALRSIDVLVLDQLDELQDRADQQQQLLAVLDLMAETGGHVLLISEKAPGELRGVTGRLVNRCHGGLCTPLKWPGIESRRQLALHFAHQKHLALSEAAALELAENLPGSPARLSQAIQQIEVMARREQATADAFFVKRFLQGDLLTQVITVEQVATQVAEEFGVSLEALQSKSRHQSVVLPRHCAMLLARQMTQSTLEEIGRFFGDRNHTTVSHGCAKLEELLPGTPTLRQILQKIRSRLPATPGHSRTA